MLLLAAIVVFEFARERVLPVAARRDMDGAQCHQPEGSTVNDNPPAAFKPGDRVQLHPDTDTAVGDRWAEVVIISQRLVLSRSR
jgi:hypothetical protein